jgi:hypothetical protein
MMYLTLVSALLALTSFVSSQATTAAPTGQCSDAPTGQCSQSSKHLQQMMMQVEIDRLRDRNDSQIFESIRSLLMPSGFASFSSGTFYES